MLSFPSDVFSLFLNLLFEVQAVFIVFLYALNLCQQSGFKRFESKVESCLSWDNNFPPWSQPNSKPHDYAIKCLICFCINPNWVIPSDRQQHQWGREVAEKRHIPLWCIIISGHSKIWHRALHSFLRIAIKPNRVISPSCHSNVIVPLIAKKLTAKLLSVGSNSSTENSKK